MRDVRQILLLGALVAAGVGGAGARATTSAPTTDARAAVISALKAPAHAAEASTDPAPRAGRTWSPGLAAARRYAKRRAGIVSFAVRAPGNATGFRSTRRVRSASVVKAMLLVAFLNRRGVRTRALRSDERSLLGAMIRQSDNQAADRIFAIVGLDGLVRLARTTRMRDFKPYPAWGGSQIDAADQARFLEHIDDHVVRRHRAYAMRLLRSVIPAQRWGIARVRPAGWTLYFKGGWDPGVNPVDHQVALLTRGHRRVALAILISGSPSSEYANETLRGVSLRLLRGINTRPRAKAGPARRGAC